MTEPSRGRSLLDRVVFGLVVVVSGFVLFLPSAPGPPLFDHADLVVHFTVFAALTWTGLRAVDDHRVLLGLAVAYAGVSELVQLLLLPGRSGSWLDVAADLGGVAVGALLWRAASGRRAR